MPTWTNGQPLLHNTSLLSGRGCSDRGNNTCVTYIVLGCPHVLPAPENTAQLVCDAVLGQGRGDHTLSLTVLQGGKPKTLTATDWGVPMSACNTFKSSNWFQLLSNRRSC